MTLLWHLYLIYALLSQLKPFRDILSCGSVISKTFIGYLSQKRGKYV